jgi:outer membrane protein
MKTISRMLLVVCLFSFHQQALAQRALTLEEAITIAFQKSIDVLSEKNRLEDARANYQAVKLGQRAAVKMDFELPAYSRSLTSFFDPITGNERFFSIRNTTVEGRLSIGQPIVMTNGQISIYGSLFGRNQFSDISGKSRDYLSNLYINLFQPLFGFNTQKAVATRAKMDLDRAERDYAQAKMNIIYSITSGFYNLYKSKRSMEITEEKVSQVEKSYDTALNKFKAGLIAEVEAMELEVDLAQSQNELFNAKKNYEELKDDFRLLIGLGLDDPLDVTASLAFVPVEINLEEAVKNVLEARSDYQNAKADMTLDELSINETRSRNAIQASINANYGINRNDDRFAGIFHNFLGSRSVTMNLSIPVFDWGRSKVIVEQARANLKLKGLQLGKMEQSIVKEVKSAVSNIQSAEARIKILGKSADVAEKSFNIKLERFANGAITSFELSQAQIKLTDMKLSVMNALIDYELARADLERKTLKRYH